MHTCITLCTLDRFATVPHPCRRLMELEHGNLHKGPWATHRLVSLADYLRSLRIPGAFNWRRAVHTLLVRLGANALLPAADFAVPGGKKGLQQGPPDVLEAAGGSPFVFAVLRDALSPLHITALGTLIVGFVKASSVLLHDLLRPLRITAIALRVLRCWSHA